MSYLTQSRFKEGRAAILLIIAAVVILGLLFFKGFGRTINNKISGGVVTITGEFTCLPAKGETDPECELGLESRDGKFYALDVSKIQDANTDLKADDAIAVTGIVRKEAEVSTTTWRMYNIEGVILVHTLLRTR